MDGTYQRRSSIIVGERVISNSNINSDDLNAFDVVSFSGKCLDAFYYLQNALTWEEYEEA